MLRAFYIFHVDLAILYYSHLAYQLLKNVQNQGDIATCKQATASTNHGKK